MSKYQSSVVKTSRQKVKEPHFAWRGIGCLMMIIIPIISATAGYETVQYGLNNGWAIPYQLLGTPRYPEFFYASNGLMTLLSPITATPHFYAYAAASILYMIILGGVVSLLYAVVYRIVGPAKYGPLDVPPPNIKFKKYKR